MSTAALKILEGGKSPGRPNREQAEANRQETHTKLRALGMYDEAAAYADSKGWGIPEKWNTKKCNDVLAWAREQAGVILCKCGQPAKHYDSDEGENAVALCEACYAKEQARSPRTKVRNQPPWSWRPSAS